MLIKKAEAKLIFIGIFISAYMTISYDMARGLMADSSTDTMSIAIAGLVSLGVGALLFYLSIRGKIK